MSVDSDDYPEAERTVFTLKALDFSALFNHYFSTRPLLGEVQRTVSVVEPEGMSTGSGATARQSIVVKDPTGKTPSITVGWVDTAQEKAHLRTYHYLLQKHKARHGRQRFTLAESVYTGFFRTAMKFMNEHNIVCSTDREFTGSVATVTSKSRFSKPSNPWVMAAMALGAVLLAGLFFLVATKI